MKKSLVFLLILLLCLFTPAASASVTTVSDETLKQLEDLHAKAEGQIAQNDFRGAIKTYEEILLVEPDDETAYTNLWRIYMILGDTRKAEGCFQNALAIDPENEAALLGIEKIKDPDSGFVVSEEELEPSVPPPDIEVPATAVPKPVNTPTLPYEKQVQLALKNAGLYHGEVDGVIGRGSHNAILAFQKFHGLRADGKVGPKTWAVLKSYLEVKQD